MSAPNYLPVRPDWLALRHEEPIEPDLPIVDAHHHLWDRPGWRYLLDEYRADIDASGHNIVATVYVQAQSMYRSDGPPEMRPVGEIEFASGVADVAASAPYGSARICAGIVGHADLRLGDAVEDVLEAEIRAGGGRLRGIRHLTAWDADASLMNPLSAGPPGLLGDPTFREGFARLAPLGLAFDAWLFHPQIPELTDLARAFPDTRIVVDHLGGILGIGAYAGRRTEIFSAWEQDIRELARCPNVSVKLGGLGMRINGFGFEARAEPPSSSDFATAWRPYIETCIEAFAPSRCMFESNFPVDKGSYRYTSTWNAFKRLTVNLTLEERADLFFTTASECYDLCIL